MKSKSNKVNINTAPKKNYVTATDLLNEREKLSKEITKYWGFIRTENVIKKGHKRNYDLKVLLTKIDELANMRMLIKLKLQCINMGIQFSELKLTANVINVFMMSELQQQLVQLGLVKTIDPKKKNTKEGKRKLRVTEELTSDFIAKRKEALELKHNEISKKMDICNSTLYEDTPLLIQAA